MENAGTKANVYITLFGDKGDSGFRLLKPGPGKYSKGRYSVLLTSFALYVVLINIRNPTLGPGQDFKSKYFSPHDYYVLLLYYTCFVVALTHK